MIVSSLLPHPRCWTVAREVCSNLKGEQSSTFLKTYSTVKRMKKDFRLEVISKKGLLKNNTRPFCIGKRKNKTSVACCECSLKTEFLIFWRTSTIEMKIGKHFYWNLILGSVESASFFSSASNISICGAQFCGIRWLYSVRSNGQYQ